MSTYKIAIPGSWDGFEGVETQADEGEPEFIALQEAMESGTWAKRGRGSVLTIELATDVQVKALAAEAKYQDEYWNTDLYGVKEGGSSCATRGRAARVVRERVNKLMTEVTA